MEVFGLMFAVSFVALLTTLVVLHICKRIDKSNQSNVAKGSKHLSWISSIIGNQSRGSSKTYAIANHLKPKNEIQEKWKESLPKHKTRIKARNKRKQRNKR